jgi:twitching motility protein PilT
MRSRIDELLLQAAEMNASDLHVSEGKPVMVRIAGALTKPGSVLSDVFSLFEPILPDKQRAVLKQDGECDFAYALSSGHRFRINLYRSMERLDAAVRIIPNSIPTCNGLGLPAALKKLSELKSGLVLLTGVTGSGKSTTLAAIINEINQNRAVHILTLEDPVEYRFASDRSLIHQREIGTDTADFASGLRAALREDPDVVVVGELRDLETISIAVTAAETGHLVLATLHTRSAVETVDRIIDVFPEHQQRQIRVQLAGSLQAVASQQLLPDKQGGRRAVFEIMIVTPALRNLIREGKTQQMGSYIQTGGQYGMQTMETAIEELKRSGSV